MVEMYLHSNKPLRDVARAMNIPFQTLWYWTKQYKEKGKKAFLAGTNRKKFSHDVEHRIMFLKEQNPSLTIRDAQHLLKKHGVVFNHSIDFDGIINIPPKIKPKGKSKLKKWTCGCTNVRVAVKEFEAKCLKCGNEFELVS